MILTNKFEHSEVVLTLRGSRDESYLLHGFMLALDGWPCDGEWGHLPLRATGSVEIRVFWQDAQPVLDYLIPLWENRVGELVDNRSEYTPTSQTAPKQLTLWDAPMVPVTYRDAFELAFL